MQSQPYDLCNSKIAIRYKILMGRLDAAGKAKGSKVVFIKADDGCGGVVSAMRSEKLFETLPFCGIFI